MIFCQVRKSSSVNFPITFKVTAKLEVMKDGEVLDECDHVIYMVDFMPNQNAEKTVGGSVNTTTFPDSLDKEKVLGNWATFPKNSNDTIETYLVDPDEFFKEGKTILENQNDSKNNKLSEK